MKTLRRIVATLTLAALFTGAVCASAEALPEPGAPAQTEIETTTPEETSGEPHPTALTIPEDTRVTSPDATPAPEESTGDEINKIPGEDETGEVPGTDEADSASGEASDHADELPGGDLAGELPEALPVEVAEPDAIAEAADLDGTTEPVDDSTALPDGEYAPEDFSFSGGTGKTTISCGKVLVSGGRAKAVIAFSSKNYVYVKASGQKFDAEVADGKSTVTIPVRLNADNRIIGMTRAMSREQEIEYTIRVTLDESSKQPDPQETDDPNVPEDGDYEFGVESDYKMFKVTKSTAKVAGGKLVVTISTSSGSYDKIYLGSREDEPKEPVVQGVANAGGGYDFTFEVARSMMGQTINFVPGKPDGSWYTKNQYTLKIPAALGEKIEPAETQPPEEEEQPEYDVAADSSAAMFKVVRAVLTLRDGRYSAVITLSGTGYDKLFMGTAEQAANASEADFIPFVPDAEGKYTYAIPVARLGAPIDVAAHSVKNDQWYDRQLTFRSLAQPEPGEYEAQVESSAAMFKVVRALLTARDGGYSAVITLSGTGYDKLFMGTAEQAANASEGDLIPFVPDAEGKYTYAIPVPALDVPIVLAAHSVKNDQWYDRTLTFKSDTLVKAGEASPEPSASPSPTPGPTPTPEADLSGATGRVDSSTGLADGTYKPDRFSFSGGTGRVSISCDRVTVKGGKATATIAFSSTSIGYVKANGQKYYPSVRGGASYFEIPVKLNANNRIIGMTTAMSQDHEVEYTIYIYLAAAEQGGDGAKADEGAPEVAGLRCESSDELDAAELFSIYRCEGGSAVIQVEGVGEYLIANADAELPAGIEDEVNVIRRPVQSAYLASPEFYEALHSIGDETALAAAKLTGIEGEEALTFAGSCDAPDYATLLANRCDLAVVPGSFADARVQGRAGEPDAWLDANLTDEDAAKLADVTGRLDLLGIPLFVDRSRDEESDAARLEWLKVYGLIFDCEDEANAAYEAAVAALNAAVAA